MAKFVKGDVGIGVHVRLSCSFAVMRKGKKEKLITLCLV